MPICFCGSDIDFDKCCQPFLTNKKNTPTAEALMRSRYSAFATKNVEYLNNTIYGPAVSKIKNDLPELTWTQLTIERCEKGLASDTVGWVEFKAFYNVEDGNKGFLWEESEFKKVNNKWFYVFGTQFEG